MQTQWNITPEMIVAIAGYYAEHARALPWRETKAAYPILVSELMLQQTRVETVLRYYARFLEAFPSVQALADAPEASLLKAWEGLGYYRRARHLQRACREAVRRYSGDIPASYEELRTLPGVGAYTAAAVASIAFGEQKAAVDGNLWRVFCRLCKVDAKASDKERQWLARALEEAMEAACVSASQLNQGTMDLASSICTPRAPRCGVCPLAALCSAHAAGYPERYPQKADKPAQPIEEWTVFHLIRDGEIALERAEEGGLLGGMYAFPKAEGSLEREQVLRYVEAMGYRVHRLVERRSKKHVFTHRKWHMRVWEVYLEGVGPHRFVTMDMLDSTYALPTAYRKTL